MLLKGITSYNNLLRTRTHGDDFSFSDYLRSSSDSAQMPWCLFQWHLLLLTTSARPSSPHFHETACTPFPHHPSSLTYVELFCRKRLLNSFQCAYINITDLTLYDEVRFWKGELHDAWFIFEFSFFIYAWPIRSPESTGYFHLTGGCHWCSNWAFLQSCKNHKV